MSGGVLNGPLFHFGNTRRHRDDDPRRNQFPMMNLLDKVAQHRFGNLEVGDHAIFHGPDGHDIPRGAPQHPLGFFAYGKDIRGSRLNRDD
jgi:hypothetical protein